MKVKVTKKEIMDNYWHVISVGYCGLQRLLAYKEANYYTCGVYGWNADVYDVGKGVAIVTGYRPFGNIKASYHHIIEIYENKAKKIRDDYQNNRIKYSVMIKKLDKLLDKFVVDCLNLEKSLNYTKN